MCVCRLRLVLLTEFKFYFLWAPCIIYSFALNFAECLREISLKHVARHIQCFIQFKHFLHIPWVSFIWNDFSIDFFFPLTICVRFICCTLGINLVAVVFLRAQHATHDLYLVSNIFCVDSVCDKGSSRMKYHLWLSIENVILNSSIYLSFFQLDSILSILCKRLHYLVENARSEIQQNHSEWEREQQM